MAVIDNAVAIEIQIRGKNNMKKIILATLGVVGAVVANAAVIINWKGSAGFYEDPGAVPFLETGDSQVTAQLIYCGADGLIDDPTAVTGGANGNYVSDDDVVLSTYIVTASSSTYGDFNAGNYNNAGTFNGNVYIRVFDAQNVVGGTAYYNSAVKPITDDPTIPTDITVVEANSDLVNGNRINALFVVVPEPATFAFMGIGGLLLALRRMRRS